MAVDLTGAFLLCRAYLQALREAPDLVKDTANIIFIGSTAGKFGEANHGDYAAAKSALMYGLVPTLKNEIVAIASRGRVNAINPGWVATPMAEETLKDKAFVDKALATTPLQKVGTPADIARQIAVIASPVLSGHVNDRELILVPKKGRPVTQCHHCRTERKKRSAHVSCECGEAEKPHHAKEKCMHLREAEERARSDSHDEAMIEKTSAYLTAVAEEQGCCCHHGGNCTCAMLKKEHDKDGSVTPPRGPAVKPRLETTKSDGSITVFQNGHHKPVHRKNHLAHESGMPYKMPMPRASTQVGVSRKAHRSVDSLALDNTTQVSPSAFLPQNNAPFHTERRMSKSEQPSPKIFATDKPYAGLEDTKFPAIDFGNLESTATDQSMQTLTNDGFGFVPLRSMSGATDHAYDPWSAMPSADSLNMPNNNPFGVWPTNPNPSGVDQPALTAASSNTQSEIDEVSRMDDMFGFTMPSIQEDTGSLNLEGLQGPGSPQSNRRSLPANFFTSTNPNSEWLMGFDGNMESEPKSFDGAQAFDFDDVWEGSNLPPVTGLPGRFASGLPNSGRPASKSLGPSGAPSDAVFQQLFPDLDIRSNYFATPDGMQDLVNNTGDRTSSFVDAGMDFGPMNEEFGFTSQPWSDGSMDVANDEYTSTYELDQDYSNPNLLDTWAQ
ncbi:hypothetical protein LTR35_005935 [Friedmanniomyces endolithicus]|nr:hypothetical protein LTR35_005935 [Friedmanniomyces endolithicus]